MRALITGASGFVGNALWQRCAELGWPVLATGRRRLPSQSNYHSHDLSLPLPWSFSPDVIFHVAARSSPWGRRQEFERDNLTATKRVLDYANRMGRPQIVYLSSLAVLYRNEHQHAINEQTLPPRNPISTYAETKLAAENLVRSYNGPWTILRPRAVFGPGDTVVFPRILRAAKAGRLPWINPDEPVFTDLIYIDTLTAYMLRAATKGRTGLYHLSNAEPVELRPFLTDLFHRLDLPLPQKHWSTAKAMRLAALLETTHRGLPFLGEPPLTRFGVSVFAYTKTIDPALMMRDLGVPLISINEGVSRFIAWQKTQIEAST